MLPLVSSMAITVIGWISLSKKMIGWGFSLSNTSKSLCTRFGTRRFCASSTVANSDTTWVPTLNVGCCGGGCWAARTAERSSEPSTPPFKVMCPLYCNPCPRAAESPGCDAVDSGPQDCMDLAESQRREFQVFPLLPADSRSRNPSISCHHHCRLDRSDMYGLDYVFILRLSLILFADRRQRAGSIGFRGEGHAAGVRHHHAGRY